MSLTYFMKVIIVTINYPTMFYICCSMRNFAIITNHSWVLGLVFPYSRFRTSDALI
jgi:hypothetical protein